ncbi:MAG: hypothetical protein Q8S13_02755, partial [Dehalococcoidia bacterium]|nr:hypothetical protein [Dehalococcoidia bacterium]
MFIQGDGTAVGPALGALAAVGALDLFSPSRRSVTARDLREHLIGRGLPSVNDYFHSPMRALAAAGLITRRGTSTDADNMLFTVTDAGLIAFQHAPSFAELFEFLPAAAWLDAYFLSQPRDPPAEQVLPEYHRQVNRALTGFPEDASPAARRLEQHFLGELLVPTLVALKNIELDYPDPKDPSKSMNLLDAMVRRGTVDLSTIGAEVNRPLNVAFLTEAFRLLAHPRLGWIATETDAAGHVRAQWTPAGAEAARLAWTPGVFFAYYPLRAGFPRLLTTEGTPERPLFETVFPRDAQGHETHVRRPVNSNATYANHGRYYADILRRTT